MLAVVAVSAFTAFAAYPDFVDDEYLNAYYQTIKNVASPELSDDAATKGYVDSEIAKIP